MKDFKSISSNYHIQTLENGSLSIKDVERKDSGHFLCEAENGVGSHLSSLVKLSVHIKPHFKTNFQVIKVKKGETLKIQCLAFGDKPITLEWIKDRNDIHSSSDVR